MLIWMLRTVRLSAPDWSPQHLYVSSAETLERREAIESLGCASATFGAKHTAFAVPNSMFAAQLKFENTRPDEDGIVNRKRLFETAPANTFTGSLRQAVEAYGQELWLPIENAAEIAGVSVRTLQRRLGEEGLTFKKFAEHERFERATMLLESTELKMAEIAVELGYSSHANFSRGFQRRFGISPSEFRRQRRAF